MKDDNVKDNSTEALIKINELENITLVLKI